MIQSFQELKNSRRQNFDKLQAELSKMASGGQKFVKESEDERFWQPTADKAGNGSAVIRFLPAPKGEESPLVRVFSHGFEGPNGWYIDKSRNTLTNSTGEPEADPVADMNRKLWAQGEKSEGRAFVSGNPATRTPGSKRKLSYYTNVYIVKDPGKKENEGTVRLYKFGARIHDKIVAASKPKFPDLEAFDPFDLFGGANFKLRFTNNEKGFRTYEPSEWDYVEDDNNTKHPRGALFKSDDDMEKVWLQCHSLFTFVDPKSFKSYNQLKERLVRIMGDKFYDLKLFGETQIVTADEIRLPDQEVSEPTTLPWEESKPAPEAKETASDDDLEFFHNLAKEVG